MLSVVGVAPSDLSPGKAQDTPAAEMALETTVRAAPPSPLVLTMVGHLQEALLESGVNLE